MAPTQTGNNKKWALHNLHEKTTHETSKEEKQDIYAAWAPTYELDLSVSSYVAPDTVAAMTINLVKEHHKSTAPVKILDAGCGTGLVGVALKRVLGETSHLMELSGVDFSDDMLDVAREKKSYEMLANADLNKLLPLPDESQDFVVCCGVYLQGHCGPSTIPNVLRVVRPGGFFITTIRSSVFQKDEHLYLKNIRESGFEVVRNELRPYLGPVEANFLTCRKLQ